MAIDIQEKAVAEVRSRFLANINAIVATGNNHDQALKNVEQRKLHEVDKNEWSGDVFDIPGMHSPWDRLENEEDVKNAIKDPDTPGVSGDLIHSTLQGDWLASQERSFRMRHQTRVRSAIHAASRRFGHGHEAGTLQKGVLGYIKGIAKMSRDNV